MICPEIGGSSVVVGEMDRLADFARNRLLLAFDVAMLPAIDGTLVRAVGALGENETGRGFACIAPFGNVVPCAEASTFDAHAVGACEVGASARA